jgi:hypothetical protein
MKRTELVKGSAFVVLSGVAIAYCVLRYLLQMSREPNTFSQ